MPICRRCHKNRTPKRFKIVAAYGKRRKTCRDCYNKRNRKRYKTDKNFYRRQRKASTKWRRRQGHTYEIQKRYGLDKKQYNALVKKQKGLCALCRKGPRKGAQKGKLSVDHNHKNNKVRGLLCTLCNIMLGRFNDDIKKFENVIQYLRKGN